jgi:hypothetical protein
VYYQPNLDIWNLCSGFDKRLKFYSINPELNITIHSSFDFEQLKCRADVDESINRSQLKLQNNFTLIFECDSTLCTNSYQVALNEVFVNSKGPYTNRMIT